MGSDEGCVSGTIRQNSSKVRSGKAPQRKAKPKLKPGWPPCEEHMSNSRSSAGSHDEEDPARSRDDFVAIGSDSDSCSAHSANEDSSSESSHERRHCSHQSPR